MAERISSVITTAVTTLAGRADPSAVDVLTAVNKAVRDLDDPYRNRTLIRDAVVGVETYMWCYLPHPDWALVPTDGEWLCWRTPSGVVADVITSQDRRCEAWSEGVRGRVRACQDEAEATFAEAVVGVRSLLVTSPAESLWLGRGESRRRPLWGTEWWTGPALTDAPTLRERLFQEAS